ncbi:hypothetical protein DK419_11565 [Methylobacterium terrae]|uniref:3-oxoacyl-ACP synthase n=1 Tax=Methylobacterium terrae TaxID=2202827 RepID=A0A2U8WL80_9HYPH|nr:BrnA antitoxin family protein [Methylobacterium terrae]AWN46869.1 hypothetical protein DK419_11565 [Methylobacterium terrae]
MPDSKAAKAPAGRTNWAALRAMPDDEIERIATEDEDNPATDESHWINASVYAPSGKTAIHATLDQDVVEFFKRNGSDYSARMNEVLRNYMETQQDETRDR